MRRPVKGYRVVNSPTSIHSTYTESLTAHEEDPTKDGEEVDDKGEFTSSTEENPYEEVKL